MPLRGLNNQTVRMIAQTTLGGRSVRVRLESALGGGTVVFGASHIAIAGSTEHPLTFGGKESATLYAGATLVSDPVALDLAPLAHVSVSLYVPRRGRGADQPHLCVSYHHDFKGGRAGYDPRILLLAGRN